MRQISESLNFPDLKQEVQEVEVAMRHSTWKLDRHNLETGPSQLH